MPVMPHAGAGDGCSWMEMFIRPGYNAANNGEGGVVVNVLLRTRQGGQGVLAWR